MTTRLLNTYYKNEKPSGPQFFAVAGTDSGSIGCWSENGITWKQIYHNANFSAIGLIYSPSLNRIIWANQGWASGVYSDTKGMDITGTFATPATGPWRTGLWHPTLNKFWLLSRINSASSTDGLTWTITSTYSNSNRLGIALSEQDNLMVTVGEGGNIHSSVDGANWTKQDSGTTQFLYSVAHSPELRLFVAVGNAGTILYSNDGMAWTMVEPFDTSLFNDICWCPAPIRKFILVTANSILWSPNGSNWMDAGSTSESILKVTYNARLRRILALGRAYAYLSSDGEAWTVTKTEGFSSQGGLTGLISFN